MRKTMILLLSIVLLVSLVAVSSVFAQGPPSLVGQLGNGGKENSAMCSGEKVYPVLSILADVYDVPYEDLLFYFCDYQFGAGQIRLALATAQHDDVPYSYQELLEWRYNGGMKDIGWGEIWQELGLIGLGRQNRGQNPGGGGQNNKPAFPPGLGGPHPGKGHGPNK
jgi:hypothetical protein